MFTILAGFIALGFSLYRATFNPGIIDIAPEITYYFIFDDLPSLNLDVYLGRDLHPLAVYTGVLPATFCIRCIGADQCTGAN